MSDRDVPAALRVDERRSEGPSTGEELVHAATHGLGAVLAVGVLVSLVAFAATHGSTQNVVAAAVFGTSLLLVYVSSTVYHAIPPSWTRAKGVFQGASGWGSLLPAVWSFMLALRERGLGSAWTTLHLPNEREVAELLGIPFAEYTQAGLFPIAYTVGTDFKPAKRISTDQFVHWDTW